MTMKTPMLMIFATISVLLAGCASVPLTSSTLDSEAKTFKPETGKANIYVSRGGGLGNTVLFQVVLDGRITGSLAPKTFQFLSVPPGEHTISVSGVENTEQLKLTAEAGKNYFYRVTVHMGWSNARARVNSMTEDEARKLVKDLKRAEASTYQ
jgi:hypothetical protein